MSFAIERIVVQASTDDKLNFVAKAKQFGLSMSELMRRGAAAYSDDSQDQELIGLADRAKKSADQSAKAIDDSLVFIAASNERIAAMEAAATLARAQSSR
jgi:oligoribonuclease (3'-5' exoribonuclease)